MEKEGNDDLRKKRGSRQVADNPSSYSDRKLKSRKKNKGTGRGMRDEDSSGRNSTFFERPPVEDVEVQDVEASATSDSSPPPSQQTNAGMSWDVESALHHIVGLGSSQKEHMSKTCWVSFRVAHSGDAVLLEKCFRRELDRACSPTSQGETNSRNSPSAVLSNAERCEQRAVRLAIALGDEDRPPSVYALVAEVCTSDRTAPASLGAEMLFVVDEYSSIIRPKNVYVDETSQFAALLERRLWLRLSALSVLLSYDVVAGAGAQLSRRDRR